MVLSCLLLLFFRFIYVFCLVDCLSEEETDQVSRFSLPVAGLHSERSVQQI